MKNPVKVCLMTLCCVALSACAPRYTTERTHPDFETNKRNIERVAIVPPVVEFNMVEFSGAEVPSPEQEAIARGLIIEKLSSALVERGYEPVVVEREEIADELNNFNIDLQKLRQQYEDARNRLYQTGTVTIEESNQFRESVGEAAAIVASYADADAVLLSRYQGFEKTGGAVAKDVAVSILVSLVSMGNVVPTSPMEGEYVEVAVFDGTTGDVLWTNYATGEFADVRSLSTAMHELQYDVDPIEGEGTAEMIEVVAEEVESSEQALETKEISL